MQAFIGATLLNEKPILALTLRLPWNAFPGDGSNYLKGMVER
jgi:hypothetical protein